MNTNAQLLGLAWGSLVPLSILAILTIRTLTQSESAILQRAKRIAVILGLLLSGLAIGLEWYCYLNVDAVLASYLALPVATLVVVIFLILVPWVIRTLAKDGGQHATAPQRDKHAIHLDPEIRAHQEDMRTQLAALPQFRETLDGDLLNLLTGDRVFWDKYAGEPCLAIGFSNRYAIVACRWETLVRYLAIQTQIGSFLDPLNRSVSSRPAGGEL